jgi:lipopolysaccharide biosynthesis glycosyltransferase
MINGGLQVVNPSKEVYDLIVKRLQDTDQVSNYEFADQSLLSDLFMGRWVPLPYIYNALKTMRWTKVHGAIWQDDKVKNMHYILSPKPWDEKPGKTTDPTHEWWLSQNWERLAEEESRGIIDGF